MVTITSSREAPFALEFPREVRELCFLCEKFLRTMSDLQTSDLILA